MHTKPKVLYLYAGSRREFHEKWKKGLVPDTQLLGLNYMEKFGIDAKFIEWPVCEWFRKINFNLVHLPYIFAIKKYDAVFICAGLPLVFLAKYILRWKKPRFVIYNTFLTNALKRNKSGIAGFVTRKAVENLEMVVCTAREQQKFLIERGFDPNKIVYQPIGIDAKRFANEAVAATAVNTSPHTSPQRYQPAPRQPGRLTRQNGLNKGDLSNRHMGGYILSVGRDPGRDFKTLLEAVRNLPVRVKVATKPEVVAGLPVPSNVEILYHVPYEKMLGLYQKALFAVVPLRDIKDPKGSDTSGQYGYLEPMASGKAVIVTDKETVRDYIDNGVNGILVPPNDSGALRAAIENLLSNPERAVAQGAAAQKKVLSNFTSEKFAEKLAEIFREIIHY